MFTVYGSASVGRGYEQYSAPTDGMIVKGKVGIGTSTPSNALDVIGTTTTKSLVIDDGGTTGTTTVAIGYPKIGKICQWNGTNWTLTWFADNSATPIYSTSTICQ
jgi:hypothetical protein